MSETNAIQIKRNDLKLELALIENDIAINGWQNTSEKIQQRYNALKEEIHGSRSTAWRGKI